ncbi:MAG: DNA helicase RecQ [Caldilinea sp.]|nr:DNA helicase RecQ [Caldilineaceae bacterium]MCW5842734.1 DNA helicase RecQ [Caldilinea sp.]
MKVLIVAKTRMGAGACVGGIALEDGRSVRLIDAYADAHAGGGMHYAVGEIWEIETEAAEIEPPHVEDVRVLSSRRAGRQRDVAAVIEARMAPVAGSVDGPFEGHLQRATGGALYVSDAGGLPAFSTCFWRPDRPLRRVETEHRIRYVYSGDEGECSFVFVGLQEPVAEIPAGTLLRLSLTRRWRPDNRPDFELRCYAQLSGWIDLAPDGQAEDHPALPDAGSDAADLAQARRLLKDIFGYDEFRPLQEEIIAGVLRGQDTLAIMPTGSGKSVCYQIPALLLDGPTVVVTPLISLMQDQVDQLRQVGVAAAYLNSTLDYRSYAETVAAIRRGEIKLIYLAPETLLRPETLVLLEGVRPACIAIDEAHCISEWGHDFRPEYRQLVNVRRRFADAVCVALTATATPRVQEDIQQSLHFARSQTFVASFNRPNLLLAVRPRDDGARQIVAFLAEHKEESGIVYCNTRKQVEELTAQLAAAGLPVVAYHAGLEDGVRAANQRRFLGEDGCIAVATIAFGMGINKPDVRFVVHHNLPNSIEHYYQQIGRAGRDGLPAHCLLLYHPKDLGTHYFHIEEGAATERAGRSARLQAMDRLARTRTCRRTPLLEYFGEQHAAESCGACDNCQAGSDDAPVTDVTIDAQKFLSCVKRTGERFGAGYIVDVLRGSRRREILARRHDTLSTYAIGKEHDAHTWRRLAQEFMLQGLVEQDLEHGMLRVTAAGWDVMKGQAVHVPAEAITGQSTARAAAATTYDARLFARLRILRRSLADDLHIPAYAVFPDRTLMDMASYLPQSAADLRRIHGVGTRKEEQFGARFLACIRQYCEEEGIDPASGLRSETPSRVERPPARRRFEEVGEMFAEGRSVEEIQKFFDVQRSTVINHLVHYQAAGHALDPARILALSQLEPALRQPALRRLAATTEMQLTPIYEEFGGLVSYEELHVLRLYLRCRRELDETAMFEQPAPYEP